MLSDQWCKIITPPAPELKTLIEQTGCLLALLWSIAQSSTRIQESQHRRDTLFALSMSTKNYRGFRIPAALEISLRKRFKGKLGHDLAYIRCVIQPLLICLRCHCPPRCRWTSSSFFYKPAKARMIRLYYTSQAQYGRKVGCFDSL